MRLRINKCFGIRWFIVTSIILASMFLSSCSYLKRPYDLPAMIVSEDEALVQSVVDSDPVFFSSWTSDDSYNRFVLDLVDSLSFHEIMPYADSRFKELSKDNHETNFKAGAIYVLYCCDRGNVFVKTNEGLRSLLDNVHPGEYYRLVSQKYDNVSSFLASLKQFIVLSQEDYSKLGYIKKQGIGSSVLSTLNLKTKSVFFPSKSFLYKLLFSIPFGIGMALVGVTGSIFASAFILLFLFFVCKMAYQRLKTRAKQFNIVTVCWLSFSIVYFWAFCCVINTTNPSIELMHRMINNGYGWVFNSVYSPYYSTYSSHGVSVFVIVVFVLLSAIYLWINLINGYEARRNAGVNDDNMNEWLSNALSDLPSAIIVLIGGACTCLSSLIYVLIAYLATFLIEHLYEITSDDNKQIVSSRPFIFFAILFICLTVLFTLVKDEFTTLKVFTTSGLLCWSLMAFSSFLLLLFLFVFIWQARGYTTMKTKGFTALYKCFDTQCSFTGAIKNPILNLIASDCAVFAGLTSPLFLIGCILLLILFPVGQFYAYAIGIFILAPCSVISLEILTSIPRIFKPKEFISEMSSCQYLFSTSNEHFNVLLNRASRFGGLVVLVCFLSLIVFLVFHIFHLICSIISFYF